MQNSTPSFEAILFYADEPRLRLAEIVASMNDALADMGVAFAPQKLAGAGFAFFNTDDMHLILAAQRVPLGGTQLGPARPDTPEVAEALGHHRKSLRLTLGDGAHYGSVGAHSSRTAATKLKVLYRIVAALVSLEAPLAVHWIQSGRIVAPETVLREIELPFPSGLALNLIPVEQPGTDGTAQDLAMAARGSEHVLGRALVVVPGPLGEGAALPLAHHLMTLEALRPGTLAHGTIIPCSDTRSLSVSATADGTLVVRCIETAPEIPGAEPLAITDASDTDAPSLAMRLRGLVFDQRVPVFALCAAIAIFMPVPAIALAAWNWFRGPQLMATALAALMLSMAHTMMTSEIDPEGIEIATGITLR